MRTHSDEWNTAPNDPRRAVEKAVAPSVTGPTRGAPVPSLDRDTLLSLQSTIGNAGVERLIRSRVDVPRARAAGATLAIQRESDEESEEEDDPIKKGIEQVGGAVTKKVESATRLPTFGVELDTAGSEFFDEMATDIEDVNKALAKAQEYFQYVDDARKYYDEWGQRPPLGPAVDGLEKIAGGVSASLGKWKTRFEWGAKGAILVEKLYELWRSTSRLDFANPASINAWIEANKALYDATTPFAQSIIDYLAKAALRGNAAASQATLVGGYVMVMFKLAIEGVEAGTRAMEPEWKRIRLTNQAIEGTPLPPPPQPPAQWMSRAEENRHAAGIERQRGERRLADEEETAKDTFAESAFGKIYLEQRASLHARLVEEIREPMSRLGTIWLDCFFTASGTAVYDEAAGRNISGILEDPDQEQIDEEIKRFRKVDPPCPYFTQLFDGAFARYRQGNRAGAVPTGR